MSSLGAICAVGWGAGSARTLLVSLIGAARVQGSGHRFGSAPIALLEVGASRPAYADRPPWLRQLPAATER